MLRKISLILAFVLTFCGGVAAAGSLNGEYNGMPIVKVLAGGKTLTDEVPAQIIDGKTMIPLTMLRSLGFNVTWNQADYSVTVNLPKPPVTLEQLNKISQSVGEVFALDESGKAFKQGSGFLIRDGILITNAHVADDAKELKIALDGQLYTAVGCTFKSDTNDICGVKISSLTDGLPFITEQPKISDKVYAVGFPSGQFKITEGKVIAFDIDLKTLTHWIDHSAATSGGSSGSPLLNEYGEVIGINSGGYKKTSVSYAISMSYVQDELARLK